jgi:glycosyltransferase involved in cell wall biosynthesis
LLSALARQETGDLFGYSVTVVDNDQAETARAAVEACRRDTGLSIRYYLEPEQNIALARNRAVSHASGDLVAFIDDDEFPRSGWLLTLYTALQRYDVDGVLGPVLPHFDAPPPGWVQRGKFYERGRHATGTVLPWTSTRTGNVLLRSRVISDEAVPFDPKLGSGGEDRDFFKRKIDRGYVFVWCDEAAVYEVVPPHRWKRSFMLKRALLRGQNCMSSASYNRLTVPTALIAIPVYAVALPLTLLVGEHVFMKFLIRLCDHVGKCLAFAGIALLKETYVTE